MGFSPEWLTLREPADRAARHAQLLARVVGLAGESPLIMDVGCGTGSTVRALSPFLPQSTRWRMVDHDQALLESAQASGGPGSTTHLVDIDDIASLPLEGVTMVTCSALLDLVTEEWLKRFAAVLRVPFYAALSYNGQMSFDPPLPDDSAVTEAFNRHQRTDKGLGPALGPRAAETALQVFQSQGWQVLVEESPWELGPESSALQESLVRGIADAAQEMGHTTALAWGEARVAAASDTHCTIGHSDVLAVPPEVSGVPR